MLNTESSRELRVGTRVWVVGSCRRSPLAGHQGTIEAVNQGDPMGAYLVLFDDGLRFRYSAAELKLIGRPGILIQTRTFFVFSKFWRRGSEANDSRSP